MRHFIFIGDLGHDYPSENAKSRYRKRFRIENMHCRARAFRIRACVRDFRIRTLFWRLAILLERIWEVIRLLHFWLKLPPSLSRQTRVKCLYRCIREINIKLAPRRFTVQSSKQRGGWIAELLLLECVRLDISVTYCPIETIYGARNSYVHFRASSLKQADSAQGPPEHDGRRIWML